MSSGLSGFLDSLPEYGVAAIAIGGMVLQTKWFVTQVSNHIEHHTMVNQKLSDSVDQLLDFLKRNGHGS